MHSLSLLVLFLSACNTEEYNYKIMYSAEEPVGTIANTLKAVLDSSANTQAQLIIGEGSMAHIDSLIKGSADLAIIENHTPSNPDINSILAFYPQILHILYQNEKEISSFEELMYVHKVFMGTEGSGTYRFMMDLFQFYNLDTEQIDFTDNPFDCEVYCAFGDIIKDKNLTGLESFKLFSFDDPEQLGNGSIAEAIALKHPQTKPFIIPRNTYRDLTPDPVLTIAVDAVLVTRRDMPSDAVYMLAQTIFDNHQLFKRH